MDHNVEDIKDDITLYDMIEALPEEDRYDIDSHDFVRVATGNADRMTRTRSIPKALEAIARTRRAVNKINDSIFRNREAAWAEPSEKQLRRHLIKFRWYDLLDLAMKQVADSGFGDADKTETFEYDSEVSDLLRREDGPMSGKEEVETPPAREREGPSFLDIDES